ncbi:MAG TPA: hypothetical protein VGP81_15465 [Pyrinomonadaceae bacterium]|jgi:hypothetical protein|nr:hypothetical protein [Pyrinomonadaceae bacterium]
MRRVCLISLLVFSVLASTAFGQPNDARKPASAEVAKAKNEKDLEAERILRERRANAQSLLISLAADATNYTDQVLRARTLARVADVLWDADPDRARAMFRKAWDAAEVVDDENRRITLEEIKQQEAKRGSVAVTRRPSIRNEVLRLVARRDRALGEELLSKLSADKEREANELADRKRSDPFNSPESITQRLNLARQLLSTDVQRALQFADPVLTTVSRDVIDFLSYLREKDAASADQRFAALLSRAASDVQSDANTVSILSSYVFTPHVFITFSADGGATWQSSRDTAPVDMSAELRATFLRIGADILLRPLAPPGQDQTTSGITGKYFVLKRLMPLFEQYAPRDTVEALRGQLQALGASVSQENRERDDDSLREGIRPPEKSEDREKSLLDRIEHAKTAEARDQAYLQLARLYSQSGDLRARDIIDKIDDSDVRNQARSFIDMELIFGAVNKKDADRIVELVRIGELTHIQKAWALTNAARLVYKTDKDRATDLLEQADAEAHRIETGDADRPRALMAVANAYLTIDRAKTWDEMNEVTKAANSAPSFTGEDGVMRISLLTKGMSSIRASSAQEFDVAPVFRDLANEDYSRTIELARLFEKEAPRASATITIARVAFEEKKKN